MPIYEYRCTVCHEVFTRRETIAEHGRRSPQSPPPACPKCRSEAVEPVPSAFFAKTVRKS